MSNIHLELLHLSQDKNSDANPSYLLSQGANPNYRDIQNHKWTPLHYAVFRNKENFALTLLEHPRTNASLLDSDGFSPLYWASKKSTSTVISKLLSKGCDPNQRDMHGMTALFAAVTSNKVSNVKTLVSHPSINVNQVNQFGGSALHHTAFATDNVEIADILVRAGANLFLIDYENQYPLHVAKRRKREKIFKYFRDQMHLADSKWKCDITFLDENGWDSETETTDDCDGTDDVKAIMNHNSNQSNFSQQSSEKSVETIANVPKQKKFNSAPVIVSGNVMRPNNQKMKPLSLSPQPHTKQRNQSVKSAEMHDTHVRRMKKLQEIKLEIAIKIDQSSLNKEARDLLQSQQYCFQFEQEMFYSSMQTQFSSFKREIDRLRQELSGIKCENEKLIKQNTAAQQKNIKLNMALTYQHKSINNHQKYGLCQNNVSNVKLSKHTKEFKKWFKSEIGNDLYALYWHCFVSNGFEDLKTLRHITNEKELQSIGIEKYGHRLRILHKIEQFRNTQIHNSENEIALPAFQDFISSPIHKCIDESEEGNPKTE